jgi:adhesin HecA-like repeat protein
MRPLTTRLLTFALAVTASATLALAGSGSGTTIPVHGESQLTFTSSTIDPTTGFLLTAGDVVIKGTFGKVTGSDAYAIDPLTGAFTGSGSRVSADGSTYTASYTGQFISDTDSVGTYTVSGGTGRFAGITGAGTFASSRWADGLGSTASITGTATITH